MEISTSKKSYKLPTRSLSARDLNLMTLYRASGEPMPVDLQADLVEQGVIIR